MLNVPLSKKNITSSSGSSAAAIRSFTIFGKINLNMKIGENIRAFREAQGKSAEMLATTLNIGIEEYLNIENEVTDITVKQLKTISNVLSVSIIDLIDAEERFGQIKNYFYNHSGNSSTNIHTQGIDQEEIRKGYKELYAEELNRIPKLEKLLRENNIAFNF